MAWQMVEMKKLLHIIAHAVFLGVGILKYAVYGKNDYRSHRAMVYFFCLTGGKFNDWCSRIISWRRRPLALLTKAGLLGDMSGVDGQKALRQLKDKGYVTFKSALSAQACERLFQFALHTPAIIRPMDGESIDDSPRLAFYEASRPQAIRYDYSTDVLLANAEVQSLMADRSILALAEMYLEARPRFDVLSMWWHTNFHDLPDSEAAQLYHFDLDRFKWLKVFIYLTDVGPRDGPHSFVEGSHVQQGIPQKFLSRGYVRLSDEEVKAHYGAEKDVQFSAPRGTIIVEDTRGLHKGNAVSGNSRLILQLQLSNSLFGACYNKASLPVQRSPDLEALIKQEPDVYKAYL
jgi:hypothetical protein